MWHIGEPVHEPQRRDMRALIKELRAILRGVL